MSRRGAVILAVAALGLAACTSTISGHPVGPRPPASPSTTAGPSGSASPPSTGAGSSARFTDCGSLFDPSSIPIPSALRDKITFGCARINVPLDYTNPTGRQISLELIKVHDSDNTHGLGALLVNPGGPGGSGVELALGLVGQISPSILARFDLIGFDPRGVGLSSPLRCISDAQKDTLNAASPNVLTGAGFQQAKQLARQVADACSTKYGPSLAQFNTVNTARDMDRIRQAVGDPAMNYLGFSYGTELGGVYAHLYPQHVRVAVLDGAVDPLTSGIEAFADQLAGFESAFDQFAGYCTSHSPCKALGDPRQAVYAIVRTASAHPLSTSDPGETRQVTSSLALTGVLQALYSQSEWTTLGTALVAARGGDGKGLLQLADEYNQRFNGQYTNIMDANAAISCNDERPGPSDDEIRATARSWSTKYPMFGKWAAISLFQCQQWQPERAPVPKPTAPTHGKVLVVGNVHDPATPYQGAINLAKTMGNAELLSWNGEGHTSYLQGSSCIDNYVNTYLLEQKLPPPDTTCPR